MRQVLLAGKYYKIQGDIIKRAISPWMAKVSAGSREYSDFSQAQLEEWHDFRNGIGLESMLPAESARTWFTEGIDFTTPRSAVLGPLINTAGTGASAFGAAPVKIIDFLNYTYAMSSSTIKKWDKTDTWDAVTTGAQICACDAAWDTQQGGNVVCSADTSDKKEGTASAKMVIAEGVGVGDIARETITEADLRTETEIAMWVKCSIALDANDFTFQVIDGGAGLETWNIPALTANTWTHIRLTIVDASDMSAVDTLDIAQAVDKAACSFWIDDVHAGGTVIGSFIDAIVVTDTTDEYLVVSTEKDAIYSTDGATWFDLIGCQGYLAFYDTKLHGLDTDGGTLNSSAANDIDGTWTTGDLTGHFGTVYDLFEGKLLADGTPILYFCGTEGLFTIDVANSKAYKQEVEFPNLTYSGHVGKYWNANVWVSTGYGILKVTPSMATYVGPDQDDGLPSTYQGSIFDMVTVNNWLVYCVNKTLSTDKSSILKRNSSYGGNLQVYTSAADTAITCLHHSPSSTTYPNGRLWFGEKTDVKYMMFPDTTSNVKQIATYQYCDDSVGDPYSRLPIFRKLAVIPKVALGVGAITKSCDTDSTHDETVIVYYGLNGAAPTTLLGTLDASPRDDILTFGDGLGEEFYTIQFAIRLTRGTTNTWSPELESLLFYYMPRPAIINAWTFNILCIEDNAEDIITEIEAIRDTKKLVVFNPTGDELKTGDNYNVALTTMPLKFYVENQGTREGMIQIDVQQIFEG